jgi:hypothetical protein
VLLLVWLVLFPLPGSLTTDYMPVLRGIQGFPLVPIFAAAGIAGVVNALEGVPLRRTLYAVLVAVGIFTTLDFIANYLTNYRNASKWPNQYGLQEVFAYVLPREGAFRTIVVDDAVVKPYIYALFYSRHDPRTLDYREFDTNNDQIVRRMGRFRFEPVDRRRLAGARLIHEVRDEMGTWFTIYETHDRTCLVQRMKPAPSRPEDLLDFPAELKLIINQLRGGA